MKPNTETKMSEAQEPVAELLPCPFCGSEARTSKPNTKPGDEYFEGARYFPIAQCYKCLVKVMGEDHDYSCKSAAEKWNTRAQDHPATIAAQQEVITNLHTQLCLVMSLMNQSVGVASDENGLKAKNIVREALFNYKQPFLDTLKAHDAEVQADLIKEIKRLDGALKSMLTATDVTLPESFVGRTKAYLNSVAIPRAKSALSERPPHIAKLIGGE